MEDKFSYDMHDQTERPGNTFPMETHKIIAHRYQLASDIVKGKTALEIGCGAGMGLRCLTKRASFLIGGEYSDENISIIRDSGNDVCPLIRMDAHHLPFAEGSFDVVVCMAMVYYLDMENFLAEAKRILKPNGILFFDTSNQDMPGFWPSPYVQRYYSVPDLADLLGKYGFDAAFKGAFPAKESLAKRKLKALVKNAFKIPLVALPGGRALWQKLRSQAQSGGIPLPSQVDDIDCSEIVVHDISKNKKDQEHKVVYVTASLT